MVIPPFLAILALHSPHLWMRIPQGVIYPEDLYLKSR